MCSERLLTFIIEETIRYIRGIQMNTSMALTAISNGRTASLRYVFHQLQIDIDK